jgi:acyl carrier protein
MNNISADSIRDFILEHCREPLTASGRTAASLPDDIDLLAEGLVDSVGIVQLVAAIEERFGITVDLERLEADQFTRLGSLARFIAQNGVPDPSRSKD